MKSLKTPLRYPGGKSRALTKIVPHIPDLSDYQGQFLLEHVICHQDNEEEFSKIS
jgi:hypothetical protein